MDTAYLVAGGVIALLAISFAWHRVDDLKRELQRHKKGGAKYREYVAKQKYALASAIVERLNLKDAKFPPLNVALYSKVCDLYDQPELMPYSSPVLARDRYDMYWTRAEFDDLELFTFWLEGIIDAPFTKDFEQ